MKFSDLKDIAPALLSQDEKGLDAKILAWVTYYNVEKNLNFTQISTVGWACILEADFKTGEAFGIQYINGGEPEYGYISISDIENGWIDDEIEPMKYTLREAMSEGMIEEVKPFLEQMYCTE